MVALFGDHGADRKSGGNSLGHGHDVRHDVEMLETPHRAGATDAGLDLVQDQHDAVFVADAAHFLQPALRRHEIPALARNRLDQDCRDVVWHDHGVEERFQLGEVVVVGLRWSGTKWRADSSRDTARSTCWTSSGS